MQLVDILSIIGISAFVLGFILVFVKTISKHARPSQLLKSFKKNPWISFGQILSFIIGGAAFFVTMSFQGALTNEEAMAKWGKPIPDHWEAGVMNHGEYYEWYTIENHPVLYGVSYAALIGSILFIWLSLFYCHGSIRNLLRAIKRAVNLNKG
jgi:hypothetical protein